MVPSKINKQFIIGVMGGGSSSPKDYKRAYELGKHIAENNYILLNGGRNSGIMEASAKGAFDSGGTTIGILPGENSDNISDYIKIPIITGIGNARNQINILSSNIVAVFKGGSGTISEIAFALKFDKKIILIDFYPGRFVDEFINKTVFMVKNSEEAIEKIKKLLK
ncbi:MAG: TIGR00725 family protein [Desulforegulaceae bacterium]|nr:TIGR00725 family protein [Desulforegulaceae bacterium]